MLPASRSLLLVPALLALLAVWASTAPARAGQVPAQEQGSWEEHMSHEELELVRRSYLEHWRRLERQGVSGLERFASTVQRVVAERAAAGLRDEAAVQLILDDLVDLFVPARYQLEKALVMVGPGVLGSAALDEAAEDLSGFALSFQAGEGRLRHFALNAAASLSAPDALVELAARLRGNDLTTASADSRADRATNRIGREFTRLLRERPLAELTDGDTVRNWLVERFGE